MSDNPFQPLAQLENERGVFGDHAKLLRAAFLYRVIDFDEPFAARFVYTGWWFRQAVLINGQVLWFRVSWTKIHSEIAFQLPPELDPEQRLVQIEIDFTRGLLIRRFRIWIDAKIAYDEIH